MRPKAPSSVRFTAPEISETVYSGTLLVAGSFIAPAYARRRPGLSGEGSMRVLVVGSGGREHALCWAIARSPMLTKLWCAPGNPGTAEIAENVPIGVMDNAALVAFAHDNKVDLVIPGPEAPLVAGLADAMAAAGLLCCGPSAAAAQLE